jgi:hypothetical protein
MGSEADCTGIARPTSYGEVVPAAAGIVIWIYFLVTQGIYAALVASPILVIALLLGGWAILMRLHFCPSRLTLSIGPWRRNASLDSLESISWKKSGGWRSRGTIYVRDRDGGLVPIYVGRFGRRDEWGPLLLETAVSTGARVDPTARRELGTADGS